MIRRDWLLSLGFTGALASGAAILFAQSPAPVPAALPEAQLARARQAADAVMARVRGLLEREIASGGPAAAVEACAEQAQGATREEAARLGVSVRRVSLRFRDPADAPDDYERAALERLAAGMREKGLPAELAEVVTPPGGAAELRYLRPIVVAPHCLGCHGQPSELAPGVAEALARHFPSDPATGYAAGDLRGAVRVRVPLPTGAPGASF
jgi:hypothetical protein